MFRKSNNFNNIIDNIYNKKIIPKKCQFWLFYFQGKK